MKTKKCRACQHFRATGEFWKSSKSKDGLRSACKKCSSEQGRQYRKAIRSGDVLAKSKTEKKCSKCETVRSAREFTKSRNSPDGLDYICRHCKRKLNQGSAQTRDSRKHYLAFRYGMSRDEYDELLITQNSQCGICGKSFNQADLKPCIDHCHETGRIRGLLCNRCNSRLGAIESADGFMERALLYLKKR